MSSLPPHEVSDPARYASTRVAAVMLEAGADHPDIAVDARLIAIVNNGGGPESGAVCGMGFPEDGGNEMARVLAHGMSAWFEAHGVTVHFSSPPGSAGFN